VRVRGARASARVADGPAFYTEPGFLRRRWQRDWWALLHPPYTAWHLAYVVIGACLLSPVSVSRLVATLVAFFLAVGVGAHALDELHGRPLRTELPEWVLITAGALGVGGAVAIGLAGVVVVGPWLLAFVAAGIVLALGYNLELFGGRLHNDVTFAVAWGAFPVVTAAFAQRGHLGLAALVAGIFGYLTAAAQRQLSTPARNLRRRTVAVHGELLSVDGSTTSLDAEMLRAPLERALRALSGAMVALAVALAVARLGPWR
jgi:hypothetical protein